MSASLPQLIVSLAGCCLGDRRRNWAMAMRVEFEAASDDGRSLSFAIGCLVAAWREMPAHAEGRFALANHALAIGMILPVSGLLLSGALLGFPYLAYGNGGVGSLLSGHGAHTVLLNAGTRAVAPSLTLLVLLLAAAQLIAAWAMLDRDWVRVAAIGRLCAATTATLAIMTGLLFVDQPGIVPLVGVFALESIAISAMAWWSDRLDRGIPVDGHEDVFA